MATITQLPHEVIVHILKNKSISAVDLMRFCSTCTRLQQVIHDKKLCERKFYQSCPTAEKKYNREKQKKIFHHINFKERLEAGLYYIQKLQYYAIMMSQNKLRNTDKKQLERLLRSITENSTSYYFVWDAINRVSAQKSCKLFSNLTSEYYLKLIFYCLKRYRFVYKQIKFINMPKTKQLLEKQLTIVAQYFQPHVSYSAVKMWLDGIVQTVLFHLKNKFPTHSICSTTLEQFSFWRDNNINDNFWDETESKQIICVLEEYIFSELEIPELHQLLMTSDLETKKYIKDIAECFRKHLLPITYHIVARRLGIRSVLTNYEDIIIVIWKPKYNTNNWNNAEYFYISQSSDLPYPSNIIRGRRYFQNEDTPVYASTLSNNIWITREIMANFKQELICNDNMYGTWNFDFFLNFLFTCLQYDVEDINIETEYKHITNTIEISSNVNRSKMVKQLERSKKIKFAVGIIVTHYTWQEYHHDDSNNHDSVIIGWHHECDKMFWIKLKESNICPYLREGDENHYHICGCHRFSAKANQPHYLLLTENNSICYAPQDQLLIRPPKKINNIEIGKYFTKFEGTYYIPNKSLREYYPNDIAEIAKILAKY